MAATECIADAVAHLAELAAFPVDFQCGERCRLAVVSEATVYNDHNKTYCTLCSLTVMHNAALLGGAWTVDALEPATHELRQIDIGSVGQQRVSDIIGESLKIY